LTIPKYNIGMQKITIEECLEMIVGLGEEAINPPFILLNKDKKILTDIAKKVYRGTALTDRQYAVIKKLLVNNYSTQFKNRKIDIHVSSTMLRKTLRQIDRSSYIKIGKYKDHIYNPFGYDTYNVDKVIIVRFPFNIVLSKLIGEIKKLFPLQSYSSKRNDKNKYIFPYTERIAYKIIDRFKNKIKDIDPLLLEIHKQCEEIDINKEKYLPGIYDYKIKYCSPKISQFYTEKFGNPDLSNLYLYKDRSEYLGLKHFNNAHLEESLKPLDDYTQKIVMRKTSVITCDKKKWNPFQIIKTMFTLKRLPLLIVLPVFPKQSPINNLIQSFNILKNFVNPKDISVLFRLENVNDGIAFNEFVRDNGLNNKLANNTKIVYINNKKIPKPLLKSSWRPEGVLCLDTTRNYSKVNQFEEEFDLVIQYSSEEHTPWNPYFVVESI
tara:strand:- start:4582 stop:5892 length:1311 start_codon:yes stop_codon:yes gene_type:complete